MVIAAFHRPMGLRRGFKDQLSESECPLCVYLILRPSLDHQPSPSIDLALKQLGDENFEINESYTHFSLHRFSPVLPQVKYSASTKHSPTAISTSILR
jgi:hypothetical protein